MSVHLFEELAAAQHGVVARWQLRDAGWSRGRAERALRALRVVHPGVHVTGHAPITDVQRWWAATLTAPRTVLSHASAAAAWELSRPLTPPRIEAVTRAGTGPVRQFGDVRVRYSTQLRGNVVRLHGFLITTPERTVIDLWPQLPGWQPRKLLREALRARRLTIASMRQALAAHRGRRGTASLGTLVARYDRLQLERCRSDGEAYAMEVLDDAGLLLPAVNGIVAGEEADLSWEDLRIVIEVDGPRWHRLRDADARKTATWTRAGHTVRRISSDTLFASPHELVALALSEGVPRVRRRRASAPA